MTPPDPDNVCLRCGYSLEGLPDEHRCPECGMPYGADTTVWCYIEPTIRYSWKALAVFLAFVVIVMLVVGFAWGFGRALAAVGTILLWHVGSQAVTFLAARYADRKLRIELVSIEPEGLALQRGTGKVEKIPWSKISRVSASSFRAAATIWRRDTTSVFTLASFFRNRADAARFAEQANRHVADAAASDPTTGRVAHQGTGG